MKFLRLLGIACCLSLLGPMAFLSSCDDNTSGIGGSIVTDKSEVVIDSTYSLKGRSIANDVMSGRTLSQLLGSIEAAGYGSLASDYVTQMMPSATIDTTGATVNDIDSICLILRFYGDKITGDSVVPMGFKVFELSSQLPDEIDSRFNPTGYYNPSTPLAHSVYTANNIYNDSLAMTGEHIISVKLPLKLGQDLYSLYLKDASIFSSPTKFASYFPGIYIANFFGSGRITNISATRLALYYTSHQKYTNSLDQERDTTYVRAGVLAASTPEVVTNNNISFAIDANLLAQSQTGVPLLVAPLGLNVEFEMPTREIISSFNSNIQSGAMGVVNSLTVFIPAEEIANNYGITPPDQVLIIKADKYRQFFDENQIPDNTSSFLATYSSTLGGYTISEMRPYLMEYINKSLSQITDDDCRFIITPIETETETVTNGYTSYDVITAVGPYIQGPTMAKFLFDQAKITFTFSTETVNF